MNIKPHVLLVDLDRQNFSDKNGVFNVKEVCGDLVKSEEERDAMGHLRHRDQNESR
jgi:hypothetical protein